MKTTSSATPLATTDRFLTYQQVADMLGMHKISIQRLADAGELPRIYLTPRNPRIMHSEVLAWVERKNRRSVGAPS